MIIHTTWCLRPAIIVLNKIHCLAVNSQGACPSPMYTTIALIRQLGSVATICDVWTSTESLLHGEALQALLKGWQSIVSTLDIPRSFYNSYLACFLVQFSRRKNGIYPCRISIKSIGHKVLTDLYKARPRDFLCQCPKDSGNTLGSWSGD